MMCSSSTKGTHMQKMTIILSLAMLTATAWAESDARHKANAKQPAAKTAAHKPVGKAAAHAPAAARPVAENPMGQEELSIAQRVHKGQLPCELGAAVSVEPDHAQPGYFNVQGKGFQFRMHPVATSTGAIRLEDQKAGAVWLQLANKSMLMDQKKGQRLADECAHPEQAAYAAQMKTNPPPTLFDTTGMGR